MRICLFVPTAAAVFGNSALLSLPAFGTAEPVVSPSPEGAPHFDLEEHLDEARAVFANLCAEGADFYTVEDAGVALKQSSPESLALTFNRDDVDGDGRVTFDEFGRWFTRGNVCLLYTSPSPRDRG